MIGERNTFNYLQYIIRTKYDNFHKKIRGYTNEEKNFNDNNTLRKKFNNNI